MNLEKASLSEKQKILCVDMEEFLAITCLKSFKGNEKFHRTVAIKMSAEKLRRLLDEVIFYKIFLVDSYCQRQLDATRYKFLVTGMEKVFRERLSASNLNRREDKLTACSKIPFDEFTALRLTERAGFRAEKFFDEIYTNFKLELMIELADLQITIEKTAEFLNAPSSEQEAFLRRIEKKSARKEISWRKVLWPW